MLEQIFGTFTSTIFDVLPIVAIIFGFQFLIIRKPVPNLKKVLVGICYVLIGITFFLIGLDMALARERKIIVRSLEMKTALPPPTRLYSMTRRFSMVAVTTAIFVAIVIVLVISRDIVWLSTIGENGAGLVQAQMAVSLEIAFIMAVLLGLVINLILRIEEVHFQGCCSLNR